MPRLNIKLLVSPIRIGVPVFLRVKDTNVDIYTVLFHVSQRSFDSNLSLLFGY